MFESGLLVFIQPDSIISPKDAHKWLREKHIPVGSFDSVQEPMEKVFTDMHKKGLLPEMLLYVAGSEREAFVEAILGMCSSVRIERVDVSFSNSRQDSEAALWLSFAHQRIREYAE